MDTSRLLHRALPRPIPLHDLSGPGRHEAERIVFVAMAMDARRAYRLEEAWERAPEPIATYLFGCREVRLGLIRTKRLLEPEWFEAVFAPCDWRATTRALHPVADAISATLVWDNAPQESVNMLLAPWRAVMG